MITQMTTTVFLDPVKEFEVVCQYSEDSCWKKISESTTAVVFEQKSIPYNTEAFYLRGNENNK